MIVRSLTVNRQVRGMSKRINIKRRVSAVMAAVLLITGVGTVTYFNGRDVYAKDTLESIAQVVNNIKSSGTSYKILEIVPDTVSFNQVLTNCKGEPFTVSGNQTMGFMGYYVAGSEPILKDYRELLNDTKTAEKYEYSSLSDSNLRYEMFNALVQPLLSENRSIASRDVINRIDSKPIYIADTDGYHEIREGEYVNDRVLTGADFQLYVNNNGYEPLVRDYKGEERNGNKTAYIDTANGTMIPMEIGKGDYSRSLRDNKLAYDFISGYLSANMIPQDDIVPEDTERTVFPAYADPEDSSSAAEKLLIGAYDDNFCYVSYNEAYENEDRDIYVARGEERVNGFFDPNLLYISTYINEENNSENEDDEKEIVPNVYAEFRHDAGLTAGYLPADKDQIVELTLSDEASWSEVLSKYAEGTPLYTQDTNSGIYSFAGTLGELHKQKQQSITPTENNIDDNETESIETEEKLNEPAFSAPIVIIDEETDDTITIDDTSDDVVESIEDNVEVVAPSKGNHEDIVHEDNSDIKESTSLNNNDSDKPSVGNNGEYNNLKSEPENDGSDDNDDSEEEITTDTYYIVPFYYTDKLTDQDFYSVSSISLSTYENGAQYIIDTESERGVFVPNLTGRGTIIVMDECPEDCFVYDFIRGKGSYTFKGAGASVEAGKGTNYETYYIRGAGIYYKVKITNNEWFKRHILDRDEGDQCKELPIKVETKAVKEITPQDIAEANLISIMSGNTRYCIGNTFKNYENGTNDISYDSLRNIISKGLRINNVPVIADYKIVSDYTVSASMIPELKEPAVSTLVRAFELPQESLDSYYATIASMGEYAFYNLGLPAEYSGELIRANNDHYVKENIYLYNRVEHNSQVSENVIFLNDTLTTQFSTEEIKQGFSDVKIDIETENYFRKAEKLRPLDVLISQATAVRYIIGYDQKRKHLENKGTMRILELEPCPSFELTTDANTVDEKGNIIGTKLYVNGNALVEQDGTSIIVTRMTTSEFIGRIEDINVDYDMIYIGMNTGEMNTRKPVKDNENTQKDDVKSGRALNYTDNITDYNDDNMDGLVYCNVGDTRNANINMKGMLAGEYKNNDKRPGNIAAGQFVSRYSGNDITEEKRDAIKDFVAAGFPVVLADNFLVPNTNDNGYIVNKCAIDSASYMYSLVDSIKNEDNVFRLSNLSEELFGFYINLSKPELTMFGDTKDSMTQTMNLKRDSETGYYYVPINFKITNKGAVSASDKYEVNLLVDVNADGKYSPTQEIVDFTSIVNADTGEKVYKNDNTYLLDKDVVYYADYRLSGKHSGVIPWRLVVKQSGNTYRRANATGYFQASDKKPKINVLQINSVELAGVRGARYNATWNMQKEYEKGAGNKFYDYVTGTGQAAAEGANIPYDVKITTINSNEFSAQSALFRQFVRNDCGITKEVKDLNTSDRFTVNEKIESILHPNMETEGSRWKKMKEEYLKYISDNKFDMIIMGFGDCYVAPNMVAVDAIKDFINSGKSILLTHDCTSFINTETDVRGYSGDVEVITDAVWGYEYNVLLRNLVGMDRYNVLGEGDTSDDNKFTKDGVYQPRTSRDGNNKVTDREVHGFTYGNLNRYSSGSKSNFKGWNTNDSGQYDNMMVSKVNDGQITQYPYKLANNFSVAKTHAQYYQLDYATDDDYDGESDIVVWYCLEGASNRSFSNDIYKRSPNDVRNNYYIYNKGNITYSGVGHSSVMDKGSVEEIKLFVNTMIAAYRAGLQNPEVTFRESTGKRDTNNIYITYDEQFDRLNRSSFGEDADATGVIGDTKEICFVPKQVSLVQNSAIIDHKMSAKLYYQVPAGSAKDKDITYNAELYPVKDLRPDIQGLWYMNSEGEWIECEDIDAELDDLKSETVYKVKFSIENMAHIFDSDNSSRLFVEASDYIKNNKTGYESRMTDAAMAKFVKTEIFDLD